MQGDTDQVTEFGDTLYQRHAAHLEQRYFGQYVLFNLETENFVVGPSHLEAIKAYRANTGTRKAGAVEIEGSRWTEPYYPHSSFTVKTGKKWKKIIVTE